MSVEKESDLSSSCGTFNPQNFPQSLQNKDMFYCFSAFVWSICQFSCVMVGEASIWKTLRVTFEWIYHYPSLYFFHLAFSHPLVYKCPGSPCSLLQYFEQPVPFPVGLTEVQQPFRGPQCSGLFLALDLVFGLWTFQKSTDMCLMCIQDAWLSASEELLTMQTNHL